MTGDPSSKVVFHGWHPESIAAGPVLLSGTELQATLLRDNPRLAALSFMKDRAAAASRLAGKSPIPDLTIGAEYIDTDDALADV